jgi:putative transposase
MNCHILPFAEQGARIRLFFMDEAGFGRISEPSYCWCPNGVRPIVPNHRVREYVYAFGAVEPITGNKFFIISPKCNTAWTNEFLRLLSEQYKNDYLLIPTDNASWHKSKDLIIPDNITLFYLPPYTPEMNPIEQVWKEVRKDGFKNTLFTSLTDVVDKLSVSLMSLTNEVLNSICSRQWIAEMF